MDEEGVAAGVDAEAEEAGSRSARLTHRATHTSAKVCPSRFPLCRCDTHGLWAATTVKKIKQDLIDRARIKKSFARTLKKEGLSSERLGSAGNATALGIRRGGYGTNDKQASELESEGDEDGAGDLLESGTDDEEEDDFEEDTELAAHRRRIKGKGREDPQETKNPLSGRPTDDGYPSRESGGKTNTHRTQSPSRQTGPSRPLTTPHDGPSLRDLKRQAYLGPSRDTATTVHPSRTRRQTSKPASAAETAGKAPGSRVAGAGPAGKGDRRRDGRPNLNARIGVMLEQIQRGK